MPSGVLEWNSCMQAQAEIFAHIVFRFGHLWCMLWAASYTEHYNVWRYVFSIPTIVSAVIYILAQRSLAGYFVTIKKIFSAWFAFTSVAVFVYGLYTVYFAKRTCTLRFHVAPTVWDDCVESTKRSGIDVSFFGFFAIFLEIIIQHFVNSEE